MCDPYIFSPLQNTNDIRVLVLHPKRKLRNGRLYVSLSTCDLERPEPFEALSYVWGNVSTQAQITVDGKKMSIGKNLHDALVQLRNEDTPRRIWADSICINQQDNEEKSHQVSMMRRVYAAAASTIMWVGNEGAIPEWEMKIVASLTGAMSDWLAHPDGNSGKEVLQTVGPLIADALDSLTKQTYFQRSWITQEIASSRRLVFTCGSREYDFDHILLIATIIEHNQNISAEWTFLLITRLAVQNHIRGTNAKCCEQHEYSGAKDIEENNHGEACGDCESCGDDESKCGTEMEDNVDDLDDRSESTNDTESKSSRGLCLFSTLLCAGNRFTQKRGMLKLEELLLRERGKGASDPRDKVYALLGITQTPGHWRLSPDYFMSTSSLYITVARLLIEQDPGVLGCSQPSFSSRDLPSWVPDWSQPARGGIHRRTAIPVPICRLEDVYEEKLFGAGSNIAKHIQNGVQDNNLNIRGVCLDVIKSNKVIPFNDWQPNPWLPTPVVGTFKEKASSLGYEDPYSFTGEPYFFVFLQVLTAGRANEVLMSDISTFRQMDADGEFEINPYNPNKRRWDLLLKHVAWKDGEWEVFETVKGYIGLGLTSGHPGDVVVIVGGAPVPFILRPWGKGFKFIGECYVHGVMSGEIGNNDVDEDFKLW